MKEVYTFTKTDKHILENLFTEDQLLMNHVVVEPGQMFPKHPTDAQVYITILSGTLTLSVDEGEFEKYGTGTLVHISKGSLSELGNQNEEILEMVVTKFNYTK